ncbi:hypothetical protein [Streptomyces sp. NPDC050564]|uniref:hypothetical protein n=1 Tax=Streptomyces sp. NPDC050564 TaxID=3365631 RepID=UPI0037ACE979
MINFSPIDNVWVGRESLRPTRSGGRKIKKRILTVLGAACSLAFLASGTASAGTNSGWVYTTDWDPGGQGAFGHDGDCLTVYDNQKDGYNVEIHVFRMSTYETLAELHTTQGGGSHTYQCFPSKVPENIKVGVRVSLIKSGDKFSGFKYNVIS